MISHPPRHLPVWGNGALAGVLSFLDVAYTGLQEQGFENRMLKTYIGDWHDGNAAHA